MSLLPRGGVLGRPPAPEQVEALHRATLWVLDTVGVDVELPAAAERFAGAGARVEDRGDGARVRIPPSLVGECLRRASAPARYAGRTERADHVPSEGQTGFAVLGECINIVDLENGERRPSTTRDCEDVARLVDALDELCVVERAVCAGDQPPESQVVHNLAALLRNTSKHVFIGADGRRSLEAMVRLGEAVRGGPESMRQRPLFTVNVCPQSPLTLDVVSCEVLTGCADLAVGVNILPMGLAGGTAPATLAGAVVQHNAEVLGALVLAQICRAGLPVTYASCSTIMDLRSGAAAMGAPEQGLISAVVVALADRYGLHSWVGGGASDAWRPDAQSGYEFAVNALTAASAGASFVYGAGVLEGGLTFDYAKLLLDCECIRNLGVVLRGVDLDAEHLALDVIASVGPQNAYLEHRHTLVHAREQSQGASFSRSRGGDGPGPVERAREAARSLLARHRPEPLGEGILAEMEKIVQAHDASVGAGGG